MVQLIQLHYSCIVVHPSDEIVVFLQQNITTRWKVLIQTHTGHTTCSTTCSFSTIIILSFKLSNIILNKTKHKSSTSITMLYPYICIYICLYTTFSRKVLQFVQLVFVHSAGKMHLKHSFICNGSVGVIHLCTQSRNITVRTEKRSMKATKQKKTTIKM